ncbi:mitochondrial genome maintenance exonuclease 1-like [Oculina patagonica]
MVHLWRYLFHRGVNGCRSSCTHQRGLDRLLKLSYGCGSVCRNVHTDRTTSSEFWFDLDKLETMNRRELQQLCKKCGVKANSKNSTLIKDLKEFHNHHLTDSSSILHYPFISQTKDSPANSSSFVPSKGNKKSFLANGLKLDKNLSLFSSVESPSQWISGEVDKLNKTVKSKGIISKTVGEYKGITDETQQGDLPLSKEMYLAKQVSVSTILNSTSNRLFMISRWQKQQIESMGKEKYTEYKNALATSGRKFHSCVNDILQGEADQSGHFPEIVSGFIKSVSKTGILKLLTKDKVLATEENVTHSSIGYSGTFDGLAIYNGVPCVIEWKTSQKPRPTLETCYDAPLQVVAYAGAINSYPVMRIPVTNCMIVIAHQDGSEADVHWMDLDTCEKFWKRWLIKVLDYKEKTEGG